MRVTDWEARLVTQHCAAECPCSSTPLLRQTLARPRADWCCAISTGEYFSAEDGRPTNGLKD